MKSLVKIRFLLIAIVVFALWGCASKKQGAEVDPVVKDPTRERPLTFAEIALKESVSDSLAIRPSWTYYQYALQAIENQEWTVAKHYLDESLRELVAERYESKYMNVAATVDSLYRDKMSHLIVRALDEVFPNIDEGDVKSDSNVAIEGVDALDENQADSAMLMIIESFLDTLNVAQFSLPVEFNERVLQEIYYMTNSARAFMEGSLNRKTAYDSMIYAKLYEYSMPRDLIYLSLVESGFKVKAYSRAKASGMWQFIPETGKRYGLEVDYWVDMRRNPEQATIAALKYLKNLYNQFGDWLLAMAAYNCGEGRVRRLLKEMAADTARDTTKAITYWDLDLPKETMRYVPRILAAMVIGHYPEQYDIAVTQQQLPDYDTVTVFDSFPLEEVARQLKVTEDTLRTLNMELVKWCTPPNKESYVLRLPVGTRTAFVDGYDKMKKNDFSDWHHHKVRAGENLGAIAKQYGIRVTEIQQANNMKDTRIRAGKTLLIPIKVTPKVKKSSIARKPQKVRTYITVEGDDMPSIARRFGISQDSLRSWNGLDEVYMVQTGDTLMVARPEPKAEIKKGSTTETKSGKKPTQEFSGRPKLAKGERYVVQSGDTYADIAKSYSVPVALLLQANHGYTRRLHVGDSLVIPENRPKQTIKQADKSQTASKAKVVIYTVRAGDNLTKIANRYGTTVAKIQSMNNLENSSLEVGDKLKVPNEIVQAEASLDRIHVVKKGEGLWDIARQYQVTIEDLVNWNELNDTKVKVGDKLKIQNNPSHP